jgi:hypothetical protein
LHRFLPVILLCVLLLQVPQLLRALLRQDPPKTLFLVVLLVSPVWIPRSSNTPVIPSAIIAIPSRHSSFRLRWYYFPCGRHFTRPEHCVF